MELHSKKEQSYRLHPDIVIFPSLLSISQCSFLMWYLCCIFFFVEHTHGTVADKGKPWFMYEAYQHIIKVQVECLIGLGVNPALKVSYPLTTSFTFLIWRDICMSNVRNQKNL